LSGIGQKEHDASKGGVTAEKGDQGVGIEKRKHFDGRTQQGLG